MFDRLKSAFVRDVLPVLVLVIIVLGIGFGGQWYKAIVHPDGSTLPEVKELAESKWSFQQYSDYFRKLAEKRGAVYAYKVLLYAPFPPNIDIHLLGHTVGDMLYEQKGLAGIRDCTQDFRNACSHSVVIGYLREHGEGSLPEIVKTCREAPGGKGAYTMCFHGLGHGVLAFTGYDFEKAIQMCKLTGSEQYHNREYIECVGGATMELMAGVHDRGAWELQRPKYFKDEDPLYPCDATFVPDEVKPICYTHLTPHLFESAGGDLGRLMPESFGPAMNYCDAIPKSRVADRDACYGGFGKEFVVLARSRDIRDMGSATAESLKPVREACALAGDTRGEALCNLNALNSLFWGGENKPDAALNYCSIASGEAASQCYNDLIGNIRYYLGGTRKGDEICGRLPVPYQASCRAPGAPQ